MIRHRISVLSIWELVMYLCKIWSIDDVYNNKYYMWTVFLSQVLAGNSVAAASIVGGADLPQILGGKSDVNY